MTQIRPSIGALALAAFATVSAGPAMAQTAPAAGADHETAIRAAVMDYFEGGNAGDAERVARAFETETGDMFVQRSDESGTDTVTAMNLGAFAARFTDPIPVERSGEIVEMRIVDNEMAFVHFAFTTPGRQYDDFFVLYRLAEEWKIVSKTFTVEPIED